MRFMTEYSVIVLHTRATGLVVFAVATDPEM